MFSKPWHYMDNAAHVEQMLSAFCDDNGMDSPIDGLITWERADQISTDVIEFVSIPDPDGTRLVLRVEYDTDADCDANGYSDRSKVIRYSVEVRDA